MAAASSISPMPMPTERERLFTRLEELGIGSTTVEHEPMFTVEQSQALRGSLPGAHTENLFLTDKDGRPVLVVAKEDTRVDLKVVAERLGLGRLSFGKPQRLAELLGVTPGSVTPFALINDPGTQVAVVVDGTRLALRRSIVIHRRTRPRPDSPPQIFFASSALAVMRRPSSLCPDRYEQRLWPVANRCSAGHVLKRRVTRRVLASPWVGV